jgi:hypothetical protein
MRKKWSPLLELFRYREIARAQSSLESSHSLPACAVADRLRLARVLTSGHTSRDGVSPESLASLLPYKRGSALCALRNPAFRKLLGIAGMDPEFSMVRAGSRKRLDIGNARDQRRVRCLILVPSLAIEACTTTVPSTPLRAACSGSWGSPWRSRKVWKSISGQPLNGLAKAEDRCP